MNVLEGFRLKIYNGSKNMVADLNVKSGNKKYIVFKCNGILKEIDLTGIEDEFVKALYMCEIDTLNDFYDNGFDWTPPRDELGFSLDCSFNDKHITSSGNCIPNELNKFVTYLRSIGISVPLPKEKN